jgi:hypothetical protein
MPIGLPMALFTALGDEQLGLLASLGGFTALYAMDRPLRQQCRIPPLVAVMLGRRWWPPGDER